MKLSTIRPFRLAVSLTLGTACFLGGIMQETVVFAADSGGGGHDSDGEGGKHGGGKGGKHGGGEDKGGLKLRHGLSPGHKGHASGVHGKATEETGTNSPITNQRFGGGSGIVGAEQIMEGPGENQQGGNGPGPQFRNQFRYWGGWTLPGEGDSGGTTGTSGVPVDTGFNTSGGGGSGTAFHLVGEPRCGDMGSLNATSRLEGKNLDRFRQAQGLLAPETKLSGSVTLLLANYQTELEKQAPNPILAGTYLGLVAKVPVTPQLISKVSSGMCVIPPGDQQDSIARAAEEQRMSLRGRTSMK